MLLPAMEERVHFKNSEGQRLGIMHAAHDLKPGERRSGLLVLHGFGSNKDSSSMMRWIAYWTGRGLDGARVAPDSHESSTHSGKRGKPPHCRTGKCLCSAT
jgi:predicted alpha/beta-hydrolase family hydrolase